MERNDDVDYILDGDYALDAALDRSIRKDFLTHEFDDPAAHKEAMQNWLLDPKRARRFKATVRAPQGGPAYVHHFEGDSVADLLGAIVKSLDLELADSVEITVRPLDATDAS